VPHHHANFGIGTLGTTHPLGRAEVERRQASAPDSGGAAQAALTVARTAPVWCGTDDSATAGDPLPLIYLPEASRKGLLRNSSYRPALVGWLADPVIANGGGKQNAPFDITRGRSARARPGSYCIRPRGRRPIALARWGPRCGGGDHAKRKRSMVRGLVPRGRSLLTRLARCARKSTSPHRGEVRLRAFVVR